MIKAKYLSVLLAAALLGTTPAASAEKKEKAKTEQKDSQKKQAKPSKSKKKKGAQAEAPKDTAKVERPSVDRKGLFHVTKVKNDWFFEVPDSLIGRQMLTTTRFTSTPASSGKFGGEQLNEQTVYFQVAPNDQLLLRAALLYDHALVHKQNLVGYIMGKFHLMGHDHHGRLALC